MKFKKYLFITLICTLVIGISGCSNQLEYVENLGSEIKIEPEQSIEIVSIENVVFQESTQKWLKSQKDPYALDNFQKAYTNLSSGKTSQIMTKSLADEFVNTKELKATHYALRIYPKNQEEQWKLEFKEEDISVGYFPFDYVVLPDNIINKSTILNKNEKQFYPEERRYTVTYDDYETDAGMEEPITIAMPVLYVVWPIDKPLPKELDYEIDYEVFLPQKIIQAKNITLSSNAIQILEREAIQLALGTSTQTKSVTRASTRRSGRIFCYDTFAHYNNLFYGSYLPLGNLYLQFKLGSNIWSLYTGVEGDFNTLFEIPDEAQLTYQLKHPKWNLSCMLEGAPIPIGFFSGTVCSNIGREWGNGDFFLTSYYNEMACHRALNYYYNVLHLLTRITYENPGINVIIYAASNNAINGSFSYSNRNRPYISIYNNNTQNHNNVIGTMLHELGHLTHFGLRNGYNNYRNVPNLIKESFASFVGWYMVEGYYSKYGYVKPHPSIDITGNSRQFWTMTSSSFYTPLFVDLMDDYDQSLVSNTYVMDQVRGVPPFVIESAVRQAADWNSCRNILRSYIGTYYTEEQINNILAPYNFWFANN